MLSGVFGMLVIGMSGEQLMIDTAVNSEKKKTAQFKEGTFYTLVKLELV